MVTEGGPGLDRVSTGFPRFWLKRFGFPANPASAYAVLSWTGMNAEFAIEVLKAMMFQAVALASPVLLTAMSLGLGISLFQAVTSIHEQTLAFVPKALGIVAVLVAGLPWMLRTMIEFTIAMVEKMPAMAR